MARKWHLRGGYVLYHCSPAAAMADLPLAYWDTQTQRQGAFSFHLLPEVEGEVLEYFATSNGEKLWAKLQLLWTNNIVLATVYCKLKQPAVNGYSFYEIRQASGKVNVRIYCLEKHLGHRVVVAVEYLAKKKQTEISPTLIERLSNIARTLP